MSDSPTPRRRLTDAEKLARLESQRQMIERRAHEKRIERVQEAIGLIEGIQELEAVRNQLRAWIADREVRP